MKKTISVLISLLLLLGGCGSDQPSENNTTQNTPEPTAESTENDDSITSELTGSKTYNFVTNLYGKDRYFIIYQDQNMSGEISMYVDGSKMAIYGTDMDNNESIMIFDEEAVTIIMTAQGIAYTMPTDDETAEMESSYEEMEDDPEDFMDVVKTGKEDIGGFTYEYEEFSIDNQGVRYYFDGKRLAYIGHIGNETDGYLVRIIDYGTDFSSEVFEIPEGIELMSFEDMFKMNME